MKFNYGILFSILMIFSIFITITSKSNAFSHKFKDDDEDDKPEKRSYNKILMQIKMNARYAFDIYHKERINPHLWKIFEIQDEKEHGYALILKNKKDKSLRIIFKGLTPNKVDQYYSRLPKFWTSTNMCHKCNINHHFKSIFEGMFREMIKLFSKLYEGPQTKVICIGHGPGGALATLWATHLKVHFDVKNLLLFTYGSPRVGDQHFREYVHEKLGVNNIHRVWYKRDNIADIPSRKDGYRHVGVLFHFDKPHHYVRKGSSDDHDPTPAQQALSVIKLKHDHFGYVLVYRHIHKNKKPKYMPNYKKYHDYVPPYQSPKLPADTE